MNTTPTRYETVEKAAWGFVDTLGIQGVVRRGEVTKVITDAVVDAMMAGEVDQQARAAGLPGVRYGGTPCPPPPADPFQALQRYLTEELPKQLHQVVAQHVRIGLSQAMEAGARSARVDASPNDEDNRVHMASSESVASAAARMQRLTDPPVLGDAALFAKSAARDLRMPGDPGLNPVLRG